MPQLCEKREQLSTEELREQRRTWRNAPRARESSGSAPPLTVDSSTAQSRRYRSCPRRIENVSPALSAVRQASMAAERRKERNRVKERKRRTKHHPQCSIAPAMSSRLCRRTVWEHPREGRACQKGHGLGTFWPRRTCFERKQGRGRFKHGQRQLC